MMVATTSRIPWAVPLLTAICLAGFPAQAQYGGGSGTADDPYQIWTAEQMNAIGAEPNDWDKHFRLMADIDLAGYAGTDYNIIAPFDADIAFTGVFDGNEHTISNFACVSTDANSVALFGWVEGENARITNLGLTDPDIEGSTRDGVAPLVDYLEGGTVSGCFVRGGSVSGGRWVGGLVAYNDGAIVNCYSSAAVTGGTKAGGLVGTNGQGSIRNSYSTGTVTGDEDVGGLVGSLEIWNSSTIAGCYWDTETSGRPSSAAGVGRTTAELQRAMTFVGWSADSVWTIDEGNDYPRLAWEGTPGVLLTPPTYGGGTGEPNDPYLIYTAEQLHRLGFEPNHWGRAFRLMADIDLQGTGMVIGEFNYWSDDRPFTGIFDGNGHTISNLRLDSVGGRAAGLFGFIEDPNAQVKDLGLIDPVVSIGEGENVGALVGYLSLGNVTGCYTEGGLVGGSSSVGGLIGSNGGAVTKSHVNAKVTGADAVGGLVGQNSGNVIQCYGDGTVSGTQSVGGLVGVNWDEVTDCYSTAVVSGVGHVGGLVGANLEESDELELAALWRGRDVGTISTCYSAGSVSGDIEVGGLVGYNDASVVNCFWDIEASGQTTSAGGTGRTTAEMQTIDTFLAWRNCARGGIWTIDEGQDYPRLWWENRPGSLLDPILLSEFLQGTGTAEDPYQIYTVANLETISQFPCEQSKAFRLAFLDGEGTKENPYLIQTAEEIDILDVCPYEQDANYRLMFVAGEGTQESPYLVNTAEQLNLIGRCWYEWGAHFKLTADIDLAAYAGEAFNIIGAGPPFAGVFDGNGHTISNFSYGIAQRDSVGLFGTISDPNAEVRNLRLADPNVTVEAGDFVGALVGQLVEGAVTNCHVEGGRISGAKRVGGLVGASQDTVTGCSSTASVTGTESVGGLVGHSNGTVASSYALGDVDGGDSAGGLVGHNGEKGLIEYGYAAGPVTGDGNIGGLIGWNVGAAINCYSTGTTTGGGLAGENTGGIFSSFWDVETSGATASEGGIGATSAEMHAASTFFAWGCEPAWSIDEGNDYPRLLWENAPGQLIEGCSLWQGDGTEADPYLLHTAAELTAISEVPFVWDRHFRLASDIDLSASGPYNAIGLSALPFTGTFDGDGHVISNLSLIRPATNRAGLFGTMADPNAAIRDLGLIDPNVVARSSTAALLGYLQDGTVTNCSVTGGRVSGSSSAGGLVGYLQDGTVTNCSVTGGRVSGSISAGGLVGYCGGGTISGSHATCDVIGGRTVGGLIAESRGDISNCSATDSVVRGTETAGGLIGHVGRGTVSGCYSSNQVKLDDAEAVFLLAYAAGGLAADNDGTIENSYSASTVTQGNTGFAPDDLLAQLFSSLWCAGGFVGTGRGSVRHCYSIGQVEGEWNVGGFRGRDARADGCFWDIESSGVLESAGGTGLTTAEMQTAATFLEAAWDFIGETENGTEEVWWIDEGHDYPRLWWEVGDETP